MVRRTLLIFSWNDARSSRKRTLACKSKAEYLRITGLPRTQLAWASMIKWERAYPPFGEGAQLAYASPGTVYEEVERGVWEPLETDQVSLTKEA